MPSIRPIFSNKKSNETVSSNSSNTFPGFIIENTSIAVDYWPKKQNSQITHSFLTHAHSDHIQNLDHLWNGQIIHCSEVKYHSIAAFSVDVKNTSDINFLGD